MIFLYAWLTRTRHCESPFLGGEVVSFLEEIAHLHCNAPVMTDGARECRGYRREEPRSVLAMTREHQHATYTTRPRQQVEARDRGRETALPGTLPRPGGTCDLK